MILYLSLYFGGMLAFALWDAYIGFGVEFDGKGWPPVPVAYGAWPITLAAAVMAGIGRGLETVKDRRIVRAEEQKRIRIAAQKEHEALLAQVEREMMEDDSVSTARSSRSTRA